MTTKKEEPMTAQVIPFPAADLDPRDAANRYRIYIVRDGEQKLIATTATAQGIGLALCTLHEEDEFEDAAVGVLDTLATEERLPPDSGVWIVNPYQQPGVAR